MAARSQNLRAVCRTLPTMRRTVSYIDHMTFPTARRPRGDRRIAMQLYANPAVPQTWKDAIARRHFGTPAFPGLDALLDGDTVPDEALVERLVADRAALGTLVAYLAARPCLVGAALLDRIAAIDAKAAGTLMAAMLATGRADVFVHLLDAEATPAAIIAAIAERRPRLVGIAARHDHCPAEVLARASRSRDAAVRERVARHPATPADVVARLAQSADDDVRRAALANPALPSALRLAAADHGDAGVRVAVAGNPACDAAVLQRLATDAAPAVRAAVARHPRLPVSLARQLARDAESAVRAAAWTSPQLSGDELVTLLGAEHWVHARMGDAAALEESSHAADPAVRHAVARNPAAGVTLLKQLAGDADPRVRNAATARLRGRQHELEPIDDPVDALLQRDDLPSYAFVILVGWQCPYGELVIHPNFPESLVPLCFREGDAATRQAIYLRFPLDPERIARFTAEELDDAQFCYRLLRRADLDPSMLAVLARHPSIEIRCEVAAHAATPVEVLEALAADPADEVRAAVILNGTAGIELRRRLLRDDHFRPSRVLLQHRPPVAGELVVEFCIHLFAHYGLELATHAAAVKENPRAAHRVPTLFRNLELLLRHPHLPAQSIDLLLGVGPGVDARVIRIGNAGVPLAERQALLDVFLRRKVVPRDVVELAGNEWLPLELLERYAQRLGIAV